MKGETKLEEFEYFEPEGLDQRIPKGIAVLMPSEVLVIDERGKTEFRTGLDKKAKDIAYGNDSLYILTEDEVRGLDGEFLHESGSAGSMEFFDGGIWLRDRSNFYPESPSEFTDSVLGNLNSDEDPIIALTEAGERAYSAQLVSPHEENYGKTLSAGFSPRMVEISDGFGNTVADRLRTDDLATYDGVLYDLSSRRGEGLMDREYGVYETEPDELIRELKEDVIAIEGID